MEEKSVYRAAFYTLGCKVNQYETGKLMEKFAKNGHEVVSFSDVADIYVVNTCTVTAMADKKSRQMLHRAKRLNPSACVVAMGCFVTAEKDKILADESIDLAISNDEKEHAFDIICEHIKMNCAETDVCPLDSQFADPCNEHTRAYIKVQDGCNQFCTYCKIPYVRGRLKSRSIEDVCEEAKNLASAGYKEIVVTGIHLSSYGVDKTNALSFIDLKGSFLYKLLEELSKTEGLERIRLGSLEPRIVTDEFIKKLSALDKVCPHFHLSLQSGCDATLVRMKRRYNTAEYKAAVEVLRKYYENPAITTDVIVGFAGETDEEYEASLEFVRDIRFFMVHVFKYSRREGTKAYDMEDQVDENVKNERSSILIEETERLTREYATSFVGKKEKCLVEEIIDIDGKKWYVGHNERYVKLLFPADDVSDGLVNEIVEVVPVKYYKDEQLFCSYPDA